MLKTKINNELKEIHELYKKNSGETLDYIGEAYQYINGELKHTFSAGYDTTVSGVSPLTLTNSRAKNTNWKIDGQSKQGVLPDGYTQLEYLQTDGNACIDTNLMVTGNESWECVFQNAESSALSTPVLGTLNGGSAYTARNNFSITYITAISPAEYAVYLDGNAGDPSYCWHGGLLTDHTIQTIKYAGLNIAPTINDTPMTQTTSETLTALTPSVGVRLFGRATTAGNGTYAQSGVRIYSFKGDTWDFIPAKNSSNVLGMYELVSGQFFTKSGTGTFTAGPTLPTPENPVDVYGCGNSGLPNGYKKLQYIESSGTQYIDTGYKPILNKSRIVIDGFVTKAKSLFGTGASLFAATGSGSNLRIDYAGGSQTTGVAYDARHNWELNRNEVYIDGVLKHTFTSSSLTASTSILLLARHNTPVDDIASGTIYSAKIWEDDILVRNMIPAKNSSNVIGMYDTVTNTFFTNAGEGDFIAGPEDTSCVVPIKVSGKNLFDTDLSHWASKIYTTLKVCEETDTAYIKIFDKDTSVDISGCYLGWRKENTANDIVWLITNGTYSTTKLSNIKVDGLNREELCLYGSNALSKLNQRFYLSCTIGDTAPSSYEPYFAPTTTNINLAAPLHKIGTYIDSVESDGTLTRGVGVLVANGTETWIIDGGRYYNIPEGIANCGAERTLDVMSTHFYPSTVNATGIIFHFNREIYVYPDMTLCPDVTAFKSWLATQAASGHPVVIYYPLATPTETSVTVPQLATVKGLNYLDIETEVEPSNVEITYRKKTV